MEGNIKFYNPETEKMPSILIISKIGGHYKANYFAQANFSQQNENMSYIERLYWKKCHNFEVNISGDVFELKLKNHWIFNDFIEKNEFSNLCRTVPSINVGHLYKNKLKYFISFLLVKINENTLNTIPRKALNIQLFCKNISDSVQRLSQLLQNNKNLTGRSKAVLI